MRRDPLRRVDRGDVEEEFAAADLRDHLAQRVRVLRYVDAGRAVPGQRAGDRRADAARRR